MLSKYFWFVMVILGVWWWGHIYEGSTKLDYANRTCDPIYWLGSFTHKEIASGFTNDDSQAYLFSKGVASDLGQGCFYLSTRLFKAVNPEFSYEQTQMFNTNEHQYKKATDTNK